MNLIDKEVKVFLSRKIHNNSLESSELPENITQLYYRNQMNNMYKQEEKTLRKIIENNTKPANSTQIKLMIYYRNRKIKNLFIRNNPCLDLNQHHVVYQYGCPVEECKPSKIYIGYTTTTLKQRMVQHAQNGSIENHSKTAHHYKINSKEIVDNTIILFKSSERNDLVIAEALLIKSENPPLNNKREGETRILNVF